MPTKFLFLGASFAEMLSVLLAICGYITIIFCGFMLVFWFYVPILISMLICLISALTIFGTTKILNRLVKYLRKTAAPKSKH
jgi:hypothetical protein